MTPREALSCGLLPSEAAIVAFTGTQRSMTWAQLRLVSGWLQHLPTHVSVFVHGGCTGADEQAHAIAKRHGWLTVVWPSNIPDKQGRCPDADVVHQPMLPLDRNRRIVKGAHYLIATPGEAIEQLRSGTWATIRYGRQAGLRPWIIAPDGSIVPQ